MNGPDDAREVETFFDELIPKQLREEHLVGATVAVAKDGRIVFAEGYGYADRERQVPVVADETLFYPGSAGKLFTWTAVMQSVEEGELDLDSDVNTYLGFKMTRAKRERRDGRKRWRRDGRGSIKTWASRCSQPERIHG